MKKTIKQIIIFLGIEKHSFYLNQVDNNPLLAASNLKNE